jgi:hypothetical protein
MAWTLLVSMATLPSEMTWPKYPTERVPKIHFERLTKSRCACSYSKTSQTWRRCFNH